MSAAIAIARLGGQAALEARTDGLYAVPAVDGIRLDRMEEWPAAAFDSPRALRAALQFTHLLELGIAEERDGSLAVPYAAFPKLFAGGFTLPLLWCHWSPFTLSLHTRGSLVSGDVRVDAGFRLGGAAVILERAGRYVRRIGHEGTWLLDDLTFALLGALERTRPGEAGWVDFAFAGHLARELGAETDEYLAANDVVFPALGLAPRPGSLAAECEPVPIDGAREAFRIALDAGTPTTRRWPVPGPDGVWTHLVFDDTQLKFLRAWRSGSTVAVPPPAPVRVLAGRVGVRQTAFAGHDETVPVQFDGAAQLVESPADSPGAHPLYDREILRMGSRRLETLAACFYAARGYQTILLPEGCPLGACAVAVQDGRATLIRLETGPADLEALNAVVRMVADFRRLCPHPYRTALIVLNCCSAELEARARTLRLDLKNAVEFIDEVESEPIANDDLERAERRRAPSPLAAIERLRRLLARDVAEEGE